MKPAYFLFILFAFFTFHTHAQTLEEAKKLYSEGKYAEAKPAFEKYIKNAPKNSSYNQWYGNCLLETGEIEAATLYLEFAASKNIQESFRSLGKLYYLQYRFEESAEAYEKYMNLLIKKKDPQGAEAIRPLQEQSGKAARMLSNCEDVQIIDSVVVDKGIFLEAYELLSPEAGFLALEDGNIIYQNQLGDKRFFGKKTAGGLYKLFSRSKLMSDWSEESALTLSTDTAAHDNYPFVLSDGLTLYFASTGRGSLGGYDLFITRYNLNNDSYLVPEQMGMPFNSIYNDYLMAIDEYNGIGYFASDRYQPEGKIVVYTFIPNEQKQNVNTDDDDMLRRRAMITSIKDSWKEGENYQSFLQEVRENNQRMSEKKTRDFEFVINDNIIYYTFEDFESHAAKQFFNQYREVRNQINQLENNLNSRRMEYAKSDAAKKKNLASGILADEKKYEKLIEDQKSLAIKIRNAEIKHLRQNQ